MTPEEQARQVIDARLTQSGWVLQDLQEVNPMASLGVEVREYPTSTGPVDEKEVKSYSGTIQFDIRNMQRTYHTCPLKRYSRKNGL